MKNNKNNLNPPVSNPPRQVTIDEARNLAKQEGIVILWRPNINLPEDQQYCLVQ